MQNRGIIKKYDNYRQGIRCSLNPLIHDFPLHHHNYIEIEWLISGRIEHELNGTVSVLEAGDCYCLGLRDMHRFRVLEQGMIYSIGIDYREAPSAVQQLLQNLPLPAAGHLSKPIFAEIKDFFLRIHDLIRSDSPFAEAQMLAYALLLLTGIFEEVHPVSVLHSAGGYHHVIRAMEYIEAHFQEQLKLSDVAHAVFLSPNHFSSLFAKVNGRSFSEYLSEVRIKRAMELLAETDRSVLEIAFDCGFNSFSAFSRNFKLHCGCSPTYYRGSISNFM